MSKPTKTELENERAAKQWLKDNRRGSKYTAKYEKKTNQINGSTMGLQSTGDGMARTYTRHADGKEEFTRWHKYAHVVSSGWVALNKGGRPVSDDPASEIIRLRATPAQKAELVTRAKLQNKSLSAYLIHMGLCIPRLVSLSGDEIEIS